MTTLSNAAPAASDRSGRMPTDDGGEGVLARLGLRFTNWAERWFPDAYVFVCLGATGTPSPPPPTAPSSLQQ
jgi:short-chain fatty acids transporter